MEGSEIECWISTHQVIYEFTHFLCYTEDVANWHSIKGNIQALNSIRV